jgi:hypothetical protein
LPCRETQLHFPEDLNLGEEDKLKNAGIAFPCQLTYHYMWKMTNNDGKPLVSEIVTDVTGEINQTLPFCSSLITGYNNFQHKN